MQSWRRFQFFEKEAVKVESYSGHPELQKIKVSCTSSGRGQVVLGDKTGQITLMDRNYQLQSFQAYEREVIFLHQLKQSNVLVSIGSDVDGPGIVKVWNFDKTDKTGGFLCACTLKLFNANFPETAVTALTVAEDLSVIAIGLGNGAIVVLRGGDIMRGRFNRSKLQGYDDQPITGLGYEDNGRTSYLFAASRKSLVLFTNLQPEKEVLDDQGAELGQVVFTDEHEMIFGKPEAVFFYGKDGRGPCFAFEGDKKLLGWFRGYLLVVNSDAEKSGQDTLIIYDLKNKFIAFASAFNGITHLVCEWGSIFVVTSDNRYTQLTEKDTQTKLELLFRRNLYSIAINLAHSQQFDYTYIVDIFRKYGDHLYSKGDFDGAMGQYQRTIGKLEPSYVIRKFLDAQRIHNLTSYLQTLHEKGLANPDHTTLLLNCYTKLKDVKKLDEFIKMENVTFEVETAIKVCKQAGYFDHALYLAKKFKQHDLYVKIQLEDRNDHKHALEYISTLDFFDQEKNLKKYGKMLVSKEPEKTTALLSELCTSSGQSSATSKEMVKARPEEFIHIFVDEPYWLAQFLEIVVPNRIDSPSIFNTLLELYLRIDDKSDNVVGMTREENHAKAMALLKSSYSRYDVDHALVLCRLHNFEPGLLYLYEKLKLYGEILQHYMEKADNDNIVETCKQFGNQDPNLWVNALVYFSQREEVCVSHVEAVLENIEKQQLLPPLMVIQILAANSGTTLGLVKPFVTRSLQRDLSVVAEDRKMIKQYTEETAKMRTDIHQLKTTAQIFQMRNCSACSQALDLPSTHFLCLHSFHQRCLGDNERECPACEPENKKVMEMKKSLDDKFEIHEQFFKQLEGGGDGFSTVAEYFGRGLFNRAAPGTDALSVAFANIEKGAQNK